MHALADQGDRRADGAWHRFDELAGESSGSAAPNCECRAEVEPRDSCGVRRDRPFGVRGGFGRPRGRSAGRRHWRELKLFAVRQPCRPSDSRSRRAAGWTTTTVTRTATERRDHEGALEASGDRTGGARQLSALGVRRGGQVFTSGQRDRHQAPCQFLSVPVSPERRRQVSLFAELMSPARRQWPGLRGDLEVEARNRVAEKATLGHAIFESRKEAQACSWRRANSGPSRERCSGRSRCSHRSATACGGRVTPMRMITLFKRDLWQLEKDDSALADAVRRRSRNGSTAAPPSDQA